MDVSRPARKPKTVTMQDVADAVNVSKQTVSAVVNGKPGITEETGRVLGGSRTARIPDGPHGPQPAHRPDPHHRPDRHRCLQPRSRPDGQRQRRDRLRRSYNLVLYNTHDDLARENFYIDSIVQRSVDGVMFISARDKAPRWRN